MLPTQHFLVWPYKFKAPQTPVRMKTMSRITCTVLTLFLLAIIATVNTVDYCPLDSQIIEEDVGCEICRCCRLRNGVYLVLCATLPIKEFPQLSSETTQLEEDYTGVVQHNNETFPWLPHLTALRLGSRPDSFGSHTRWLPVTQISRDAFRKLPKLENLTITMSSQEKSFLASAVTLQEVVLTCTEEMTLMNFKSLFSGTKLQSLTTAGCGTYALHERSFDIPPKHVRVIHTHIDPHSISVVLPGSHVEIIGMLRPEDLNFTHVRAESILIECDARSETLGPRMLDWVDRTDAKVRIKIRASDYNNLRIGSHVLDSLEIQVTFYEDVPLLSNLPLRRILDKCGTVNRLVLSSSSNSPIRDLRLFRGSDMLTTNAVCNQTKELEVYGYPFGLVNAFNRTVTKFVCRNCQMYYFDCFKTSGLRYLEISGDSSVFRADPHTILAMNPDLEVFILRTGTLRITAMSNFSSHPNIRHLEYVGTSNKPFTIHDSFGTVALESINLTGQSSLEKLVIRNTNFQRKKSSKFFFISNLAKIKSLDISFISYGFFETNGMGSVTFPEMEGAVDNLFAGLDSLADLRLIQNLFWGSSDHLVELLRPVADTMEVLDLSQNRIKHLPTATFVGMQKLRRFYMTGNQLTTLDGCVFSRAISLSRLVLDQNRIEMANAESVTCLTRLRYLRKVDLSGNRLRCTCSNRRLRDFMQLKKFIGGGGLLNKYKLRSIRYEEMCPTVDGLNTTKFLDYHLAWVACDFHKESVIIGSTLLTLIFILASVYALHYYRYDILYWWVVKRRHRVNRQQSIHPSRRFHAFLSYTSSQQELAEHIFRTLEENDEIQFRIAYDCRDFLPLYDVADNIIRCIDASEKVIFLISKRFLEREWCQFEMNFAQMRCFDERKNLIILIFVEKFKMHELPKRIQILCRHVNYLEYPDGANERAMRHFWHRLRLSLAEDSELEIFANDQDQDTVDYSMPGPHVTGDGATRPLLLMDPDESD